MKSIFTLIIASVLIVSCSQQTLSSINQEDYNLYGAELQPAKVLTEKQMMAKFAKLNVNDTIQTTFQSTINKVCTKKGCWMDITLDDQSSFVKFKDYAFFVPTDTKEGTQAILSGKAFVKEVSVDELKHYAEDAGKSKEEIAKITKPELKYQFLADGVLLKKG